MPKSSLRKDNGGWSVGMTQGLCPKCGESGPMVETQIYGRRKWTHFCNVCAANWVTHEKDEDDEGPSDK